MTNKDELLYKINTIIDYLKKHNWYDYKLYNKLCPGMGNPDSNIVEYAEDVKNIVIEMIKSGLILSIYCVNLGVYIL